MCNEVWGKKGNAETRERENTGTQHKRSQAAMRMRPWPPHGLGMALSPCATPHGHAPWAARPHVLPRHDWARSRAHSRSLSSSHPHVDAVNVCVPWSMVRARLRPRDVPLLYLVAPSPYRSVFALSLGLATPRMNPDPFFPSWPPPRAPGHALDPLLLSDGGSPLRWGSSSPACAGRAPSSATRASAAARTRRSARSSAVAW